MRRECLILLTLACTVVAAVAQNHSTGPGYVIREKIGADAEFNLRLSYAGNASVDRPWLGAPIPDLVVNVSGFGAGVVRVTVDAAEGGRWRVPGVVSGALGRAAARREAQSTPAGARGARDPAYQVLLPDVGEPFQVAVVRTADGATVFNSSGAAQLCFRDAFLEFGTVFQQASRVSGLGERIGPLNLAPGNYTLWNHDQGPPGTGGWPLMNYYGSHPMAVIHEPGGAASGLFLLTSNAVQAEVSLQQLNLRVIGGVIDLFIMTGPTVDAVAVQYQSIVGRPSLPPYWAIGYHQCRDGYHTLEILRNVSNSLNAAQIPVDTLWNDIDYMTELQDFALDPTRFPHVEMRSFVEQLHANGKRYVLILDPAIHVNASYGPYQRLVESGAVIRNPASVDDNPFRGRLWAGDSVWPDFTSQAGGDYWQDEIRRFHAVVPFDGLWIDENEISQLDNQNTPSAAGGADAGAGGFNPERPPFVPPTHHGVPELSFGTVNVSARTSQGLSYNLHNMYGLLESRATVRALEALKPGMRTFVLSRSTFPSSGASAVHWLGDNLSTFRDLAWSIPGTLLFQLFGIPMTGADTCGFLQNTTSELCTRWFQTAAFLPFFRSHNSAPQGQEPYAWGEPTTSRIRAVIRARYELLPLYYTLLASISYPERVSAAAGTVVRSLQGSFPMDAQAHGIDAQFMVGGSLLVSPVLEENMTTVRAYFPVSKGWYEFDSGKLVSSEGGEFIVLTTPIEAWNLHIQAGSIVPIQPLNGTLSTVGARLQPLGVVVAVDAEGSASGEIYLDDGISIDVGDAWTTVVFSSKVTNSAAPSWSLTFDQLHAGYVSGSGAPCFGRIIVMGLGRVDAGEPRQVVVDGVAESFSMGANGRLEIDGLSLATTGLHTVNVLW